MTQRKNAINVIGMFAATALGVLLALFGYTVTPTDRLYMCPCGHECPCVSEPDDEHPRFSDAEERHLDTLNSVAAMELLAQQTAEEPDEAYVKKLNAAYKWACDNTSYYGGQKTVPAGVK